MARRKFLAQLASLPYLAWELNANAAADKRIEQKTERAKKPLKIMMKSAWGPEDPTRASFPFLHGLALADAGHDVQIFLLAEATLLMRESMVSTIFPVGWPPLKETREKIVAKRIPVFS